MGAWKWQSAMGLALSNKNLQGPYTLTIFKKSSKTWLLARHWVKMVDEPPLGFYIVVKSFLLRSTSYSSLFYLILFCFYSVCVCVYIQVYFLMVFTVVKGAKSKGQCLLITENWIYSYCECVEDSLLISSILYICPHPTLFYLT